MSSSFSLFKALCKSFLAISKLLCPKTLLKMFKGFPRDIAVWGRMQIKFKGYCFDLSRSTTTTCTSVFIECSERPFCFFNKYKLGFMIISSLLFLDLEQDRGIPIVPFYIYHKLVCVLSYYYKHCRCPHN